MDILFNGFKEALALLAGLDPYIISVTMLSLKVSLIAVAIALLIGIPAGVLLSLSEFPGRGFVVAIVNTGMSLPPVLAGLVVYLFLCRSGPLGSLNLLYSPAAIVIAQVIIAVPVVAGLTMASLKSLDPALRLQALGLGASWYQCALLLLREGRFSNVAAVMAAFGAVISEVGAVMIVGGDIKGDTRVLTTALVLETRMGNYERALAMGMILLLISFAINAVLTFLQHRGKKI
ncbi:MAG: ABC transporter permease [Vulcanimicrobiota bacterium]